MRKIFTWSKKHLSDSLKRKSIANLREEKSDSEFKKVSNRQSTVPSKEERARSKTETKRITAESVFHKQTSSAKYPTNGKDYWQQLPDDVICHIFYFLSARNQISLAQVNARFNRIITTNSAYWKKITELKWKSNEIVLCSDNWKAAYLSSSSITSRKVDRKIGRERYIHHICLDGLRLGALPARLFNLEHLQVLDLTNNKISVIPPEISKLVTLKILYLGNNEIRAVPVELFQLVNLMELHLFSNQIEIIPDEIGNLCNLIKLSLSNNQLLTIPITKFTYLKKLTYLTLFGNPALTPDEIHAVSAILEISVE